MKVLIADKFPEYYVEKIKGLGLEVYYDAKLSEETLPAAVKGYDILIVRSTVVSEATVLASDKLSLIIRAGAGINTINIAAANKRGIYVTNCPGKNSIAVAELTLALITAIDRKIPDNVADFKAGKWNKGVYSKAEGLYGKTLGIVGTGQIGQEVINRALSFGMRVIAWSRSLTPEKATELGVVRASDLQELFSLSDIVSVHLAQNSATKGLINAGLLSLLKKGSVFINTSRAGIVDETALIELLKSGKISVGLDVFNNEPEGKDGQVNSELSSLPNVYVTHHIGASTEQAQNAVAEETYLIIHDYIKLGNVRNWVNRCPTSSATHQLIVRHYDKPGVLSKVLGFLSGEGINVQEIENVIFDGQETACCTIKLELEPSAAVINNLNTLHDEVIDVSLIKL